MMRKKIVKDKNKVKEKLRFMLEYEGGFSKRKHKVSLKSETLGFDDEKSQRLALYEGVSSSIMSGSGKYFLSPFIIELGASSFQIGLLNAVGSLVTALSQLVNTEIVDRFKKRKKIVLTGIILQSLVWIPLFLNALLWKSVYLTIFLFGVYSFITPLVTIPMFSWLGDIVFKNRAEFFGRRSQIMGVVNFTTTILGGFLLKRFVSINTLLGFALLFLISSISRFSGYFFVKKMREPEYRFSREHYFSFLDFIRRMYYNNFGLFVLFLALFMFSIGTSSPYFTPYMLRDLGFNYTLFITIDLSIFITMYLSMRSWGRIIDKIGSKRVLTITSYLIAIYPLLWLFSRNPYYLLIVNLSLGFAWGGFLVSVSNYIYDSVTPEKRARCSAYSDFFKGVGMFLGIMSGALLISKHDLILNLLSHNNLLMGLSKSVFSSKYSVVFLASGVLRMATTLFFINRIKETRVHDDFTTRFVIRTITATMREGLLPIGFLKRRRAWRKLKDKKSKRVKKSVKERKDKK